MSGEIIQVVSLVKYLVIILDSTLSFKKQVKKVLQITKYNLSNFRYKKLFKIYSSKIVYKFNDYSSLNILYDNLVSS